jgi:hypothetical protein
VAVSIRSALLLRMLAEKQPGTTGPDSKLVRPVPRAKRMLTDTKTFSKLVQVLLFPSRHLVAAVMPVIQVVLSKNDPMTIRTALRSGLLYLLLLGLKHILENDSEVKVIEPNARDILWPSGTFESSKNDTHSSTAVSDVSLAGTGAGAVEQQLVNSSDVNTNWLSYACGRGQEGGGEREAGAQTWDDTRTSEMVDLLGTVLGLLQPSSEAGGRLDEESRAVAQECRQMLEDLLPHPLMIVLERQGPCALARTLSSEVMSPTVVWTKSMREVLWEHLHSHLDGFEMELAVSPNAVWQFARAAPVSYREHEECDWLGTEHFGYYLELLALQLREKRSSSTEAPLVVPADVPHFQSLLLARLNTEKHVQKQAVVLSILAEILASAPATVPPKPSASQSEPCGPSNVPQKPAVSCPHEVPLLARNLASFGPEVQMAHTVSETFPAAATGLDLEVLLALLKQHTPVGAGDVSGTGVESCGTPGLHSAGLHKWEPVIRDRNRMDVLLYSIRVLQWIITPISTAGRITATAAAAAAAAVDKVINLQIPNAVEEILRWSIEGIFYLPEQSAPSTAEHPLTPLLPVALACIRFCEEVARSSQGLLRLEQERSLVEILLVCLQCDDTSIIEAATSCVGRLCMSHCLHAALIDGSLHLLLLRQLLRDVHCMMEGTSRASDNTINPRIVRRRSLATVQALGQFVNRMDPSNHYMESELCSLLTRPMIERLEIPDDFLAVFAGETFTPEVVWGAVNRNELAQLIKATFHDLHVTSPKMPGGLSSRPPLWGQGLLGTNVGSAGEVAHLQTQTNSQASTPNSATSPLATPAGTRQRLVLPVKDFSFSNVRGLTRVGGIYIEIFNQDPNWQVEDPPSLLGKLFDAIAHGVDGRPASLRQRREALQAALHLAQSQHPSLPRSSVLISPTRIVLLIDMIRCPVGTSDDHCDSKQLFPSNGCAGVEEGREARRGENEEANETEDALKLQVLALQLMALGSRAARTSQVLVEQGLPGQLVEILQGHVDRFFASAEGCGNAHRPISFAGRMDSLDSSLEYENWTPTSIKRLGMSLDSDTRMQQRLESQIAIIEVMSCVGSHSQAQLKRFSEGVVMPSLLLYLLVCYAPLPLRAAAARALAILLCSSHAAAAEEFVSSLLPPFLVEKLAGAAAGVSGGFAALPTVAGGKGNREYCSPAEAAAACGATVTWDQQAHERARANLWPAVRDLLYAVDHDLCDIRHEWTSEIREQVIKALTRAVQRRGYREGRMAYLQRLSAVSVEGFILHRLNKMAAEGAEVWREVDPGDAARLFTGCVAGVSRSTTPTCSFSLSDSCLEGQMICAIAELARAGLISKTLWSEHAQTLVLALLSIMVESLKGQTDEACVGGGATGRGVGGSIQRTHPDGKWGEKGLCGWLHTLLRAAAPAASFEAAAPLLSKPPFVRVLVQVRMCFRASVPSSLSHVSPRALCLFDLIYSAPAP